MPDLTAFIFIGVMLAGAAAAAPLLFYYPVMAALAKRHQPTIWLVLLTVPTYALLTPILIGIGPGKEPRFDVLMQAWIPSAFVGLMIWLDSFALLAALSPLIGVLFGVLATATLPKDAFPERIVIGAFIWHVVVAAGLGVSAVPQWRLDRYEIGRCFRCGYDLKGLESKICPECGKSTARVKRWW